MSQWKCRNGDNLSISAPLTVCAISCIFPPNLFQFPSWKRSACFPKINCSWGRICFVPRSGFPPACYPHSLTRNIPSTKIICCSQVTIPTIPGYYSNIGKKERPPSLPPRPLSHNFPSGGFQSRLSRISKLKNWWHYISYILTGGEGGGGNSKGGEGGGGGGGGGRYQSGGGGGGGQPTNVCNGSIVTHTKSSRYILKFVFLVTITRSLMIMILNGLRSKKD